MRATFLPAVVFATITLSAQNDPVYYWALDEYTGTTAHDWAGGANGQLQGNTTWLPDGGQFGGALRFYGDGARVDAGPCELTSGTGDQLTLACWFRPEVPAATERVLLAKTIGNTESDFVWSLSLVNSVGARFRVRTAGVVHSIEVPNMNLFANMWYHLCGVYDGQEMRLYVNGSLVVSGNAAGMLGSHPEAPTTMGDLTDGSGPYMGALDDVRVFDHALNTDEINLLVMGDVATEVEEPIIRLDGENRILAPQGGWVELRVMDTSGRLIRDQNIAGDNGPIAWAPPAAGLYLVCLQGRDGTMSGRLFVR